MKMQILIFGAILAGGAMPADQAAEIHKRLSRAVDPPTDAEAGWKEVLSQVPIGMRRAAVEQVLARHDVMLDFDLDPAIKAKVEKGGRTALYILDDNFCAAI